MSPAARDEIVDRMRIEAARLGCTPALLLPRFLARTEDEARQALGRDRKEMIQ